MEESAVGEPSAGSRRVWNRASPDTTDDVLRAILASAAGDRDPVVRTRAAWALAQQRNAHLVTPLGAALLGAD
jgi:hypothetical protein